MRKELLSVCFIAILILSLCGCAQTAEDTPAEETENVEQEDTESESEETATYEEEYSESEEKAEPIYIIEPQLTQDDMYEMQDWQAAYAEYIEGLEWKENYDYSLIYVNDDDIPELVVDTGMEANGCYILTYHNGEVDALRILRLNFYYIEKKNLVNNSDGHMGYYYDYIYSIDNGKWVCVANGEWTETMGDDDWVYQYEWEGKEVGEDVYEQRVNAVFNTDQAIVPDQYYILEEMLSLLRTGDCMSRRHRYELFIEDVTWDEAKKRCEERGGYLATVTAIEELERIRKGIQDSGQTDIAFWVGASCEKGNVGKWWHEPNQDADSYSMSRYNAYRKFWAADEPSVYIKIGEGILGEDGVYVAYDDAEGTSFLYDAPKDILAMYPEYEGKIGYICEYDE